MKWKGKSIQKEKVLICNSNNWVIFYAGHTARKCQTSLEIDDLIHAYIMAIPFYDRVPELKFGSLFTNCPGLEGNERVISNDQLNTNSIGKFLEVVWVMIDSIIQSQPKYQAYNI